MALTWASNQSQGATSGLIAAYNLNEGTGSTIADVSGNNIAGTLASTTWTTVGRYGNALSFNGSTSYVNLGNPTALQLTGSMTWSAWIKASANPSDDGQIVSKSDNTSGWQLKTSPDTGPHTFGIAISSGVGHVQRYSSTVRLLNTWYHVAGVYNAPARTLDIYVNGVLNNGVLRGTVPASQVNSTANVNIGRRSGGYYFNGVIDDVRIYNRPLSQTEIQGDMNTPVGTITTTDTQPPSAPGALTTSAVSGTQINLNWSAATDNVAVTGYRVERCQGTGCSTFAKIAAPAAAPFSDTGLTAGTSYSYRVRAIDAASNLGSYSNTATATTTAAADTQPPSAPGALTTSAVSGTQINLNWSAATDNVAVTGCRVERCLGAGCSTFTQIASLLGTSYNDTGVTAGNTYSYRVRATDAASNMGPYSNTASATTSVPVTSGLVSAYSFGEGAGSAVMDASSSGNTGSLNGVAWTANGKYGSALSFDGTSSYVDLGNPASLQLTGSMTVSAWINAVANPSDDGQIVAKSDDASGWQLKTSPDTGPPTFGIKVSGSSGGQAQRYSKTVRSLNIWYHVTGVYNAAAQTLDIYVNGVLDNGVLLGTIPSSQSNSVVNANIGRRTGGYLFNGSIDEVRIYNRPLTQAEIQSDMITPVGSSSIPPTTYSISGQVSGSAAQLTLSGAASGSTSTDASGNYTFFGLPNGTYVITPSQSGFAFTPSNRSILINGSSQTAVNFTAATAVPHNITLTWTSSTSPSISGYNVYRSTVSGGTYTRLNSIPVTTTSYLDSSVTSGQTYFYVATTVQSTNESLYSSQISGVVPTP